MIQGTKKHCHLGKGLKLGEIWDVAGLIAPRHLLAVNGKADNLHENSDIERAAHHTRLIYDAAGVPGHFEHRWGDQGHRFYSHLMWDFITKALVK